MNSQGFEVFAPLQKTLQNTENDTDTLIIEGIASTTNKDLQGDIMSLEAIQSMKKQATHKNLHGDHNYGLFGGLIGTIKEVVDTPDNQLKIKAEILPKYAPEIRQMLDIGVNLGLSIGGRVKDFDKTADGGWTVKDINLMEISLTGMPANWDTYGTIITSKGLVSSKCFGGACKTIIQEMGESNMEPNNNESGEATEAFTEQKAVDLFNELMSEKQEEIAKEILELVQKQVEDIVDKKVEEALGNNEPKQTEPAPAENGEATAKALEDMVSYSINKAMGDFFKKIDEERKPAPAINNAPAEPPEPATAKTYDIKDIAKNLSKTTQADFIASQI